ncbi:hypothetical protein [Algicella marina]|uniref:Uncharacterized protein n=1 Tax=Algicella marina TaxID=2683284 RepID=A0A6P1SYS2_9RHOB|nr:hypothetical protein [Algicella marina]QHQ35834.1 hypothetical protein GO499_11955 [Algicella marina]
MTTDGKPKSPLARLAHALRWPWSRRRRAIDELLSRCSKDSVPRYVYLNGAGDLENRRRVAKIEREINKDIHARRMRGEYVDTHHYLFSAEMRSAMRRQRNGLPPLKSNPPRDP